MFLFLGHGDQSVGLVSLVKPHCANNMLLKYFYDKALAHASYMVGCQKTGEAVIIDPGRDIAVYLAAADAEGMRIAAAADTHIHADYVSGARELAERCGAKLYLSDAGPPEWKVSFADDYDHQLLRDGDHFHIGNIRMEVLHTPGHTPESISFILTDEGGGASTPMGIFTGDFVFVGSIGRPDLLEEAAGLAGTAAAGAKDLFASIRKFNQLPDHLQVWPAHGAGSACGKGLGAIPSSTVGYEKRYNPALQFEDEDAFVDYILSEQPEAPRYFAVMKRVNKEGPKVLGNIGMPPQLEPDQWGAIAGAEQVIDTRGTHAYASGHAAGSYNIPLSYLSAWAGWFVAYERPVFLVTPPADRPEAMRVLRKIGIDTVSGFFDPAALESAGLLTGTYLEEPPAIVAERLREGNGILIDVRGDTEWKEQHIVDAKRCFLAHLPERLSEYAGDCALIFQCRSGRRSAIAASLAKAAGVEQVVNLTGGIRAWADAGLPVSEAVHDLGGPGGPRDEASIVEGACQSQAVFWNAQCPR